MLMQELWKAKLDWNTPLPAHLQQKWSSYCAELHILKAFRIDRCIIRPSNETSKKNTYKLHGFSDASEQAYFSCVYIRTNDENGHSSVKLVAAKTKIAPIKKETIPRLELCGAVLLSKLIKIVQDSSKIDIQVLRGWTDSTIVLDWLVSTKNLPVFQANRVYKIQSIIPSENWYHVAGNENLADPASRGIFASSLINHSLWLYGPPWLSAIQFHIDTRSMISSQKEESTIINFVKGCSSFVKMKRVIAYCLRFISNCTNKIHGDRKLGLLSVDELNHALTKILMAVQSEAFRDEIRRCQQLQVVNSNVKFLSPFINKDRLLRVGGRLQNSLIPYEKKHPILLPRKHNFTDVLVRHFHFLHLHAAPQLLLATLREQYWIVRGSDVVKTIVRKCVICHQQNKTTLNQIMGQLPAQSVTPARPFSKVGVDYAGQFLLCVRPGRRPLTMKSYVAVFVCMASRAVHLEYSGDLTTQSFINALTRFISRRGIPSDIYCDGGSNFLGAKIEMEEFTKFIQANSHKDAISTFASDRGIKYPFNPPLSPHHGGLWEAAVKSMKYHLKRVTQNRKLSIEEFTTLPAQVEACLNSRLATQTTSQF